MTVENGPPDSSFRHLFLDDQPPGLACLIRVIRQKRPKFPTWRETTSNPTLDFYLRKFQGGQGVCVPLFDLLISEQLLWLPCCLFQLTRRLCQGRWPNLSGQQTLLIGLKHHLGLSVSLSFRILAFRVMVTIHEFQIPALSFLETGHNLSLSVDG